LDFQASYFPLSIAILLQKISELLFFGDSEDGEAMSEGVIDNLWIDEESGRYDASVEEKVLF
jgi:hypothetical protein